MDSLLDTSGAGSGVHHKHHQQVPVQHPDAIRAKPRGNGERAINSDFAAYKGKVEVHMGLIRQVR